MTRTKKASREMKLSGKRGVGVERTGNATPKIISYSAIARGPEEKHVRLTPIRQTEHTAGEFSLVQNHGRGWTRRADIHQAPGSKNFGKEVRRVPARSEWDGNTFVNDESRRWDYVSKRWVSGPRFEEKFGVPGVHPYVPHRAGGPKVYTDHKFGRKYIDINTYTRTKPKRRG
jgi:hypothetical protein